MADHQNEQPVQIVSQILEVDSTETLGNDSERNDGNELLVSAPSTSPVVKYSNRHGRRYHTFDEDAYFLPNDETEIKRLSIQHHTWRLSLSGKLYISPIPANVEHVVDIGTGAGQWAIEFAGQHPSAQVLGTDLSPIQPAWKPSNCTFLTENAEDKWNFGYKFDFIHSRMLMAGIHDWPKYFKQTWDSLKPGGWMEVHEVLFPIGSADELIPRDSALWKFSQHAVEAAAKIGIDMTIAPRFKGFLVQQGFVNIRSEPIKWAVGTWPKGAKAKDIGWWTRENTRQFITPMAMDLFTKHLGWSSEEVELLLADVRKDVEDRRKHFYWQMYIYSAQKPETAN